MLTKSTGIKNICRGKLGFLKFSAFYKGKHTLDQSDWAAVYKEKTVPRRMFLISMDSYHKILLVLGTIVRLEGCCRPLSLESQDTVTSSVLVQGKYDYHSAATLMTRSLSGACPVSLHHHVHQQGLHSHQEGSGEEKEKE